jgi:small nuclear ribonucleoprotein (snRNP)-like protein
LQGFDEFMNLVIDDAVEVKLEKKDAPEERRKLGENQSQPVFYYLLTHPQVKSS